MTKEIPLVNGKGVVLVDETDCELLIQSKWYLTNPNGTDGYAVRNVWDDTAKKCRKQYMHRMILDAPKGMVVDHINGNGLDNRRSNIRLCSQQQNLANIRRHNNVHGYKGVILKAGGRYRARVKVNGHVYYAGTHDTPEEAAAAYDAKAIELNGEFAATNFPVTNRRSA